MVSHLNAIRYKPNWESLDSRPIPEWYDEAKIGIFLHWGLYSVPSYGAHNQESAYLWKYLHDGNSEVTRFMKKYYPARFTYPDFASTMQVQLYEPDYWADIFQASGAK